MYCNLVRGVLQAIWRKFFDVPQGVDFAPNFFHVRKDGSVEIFGVSAREGFDPNFLRFRKRGFSGSMVRLLVCAHVGVEGEVVDE